MNKLTIVILALVLAAIVSGLVYEQIEIANLKSQQETSSPQLTPAESPTFSITPTSTPFLTSEPSNTISPTQTSTPTLSPTSTPNYIPSPTVLQLPTTGITATLDIIRKGNYLLVKGTVVNNNTNGQFNVGLVVFADGYPIIGNPKKQTLINLTIPISSGTYVQTTDGTASANGGPSISNHPLPLSYLTPYESVDVEIVIYPLYQSETPTLYDLTVYLI